ncbi:hypothetical protein [Mucilaginibacter sp. OK283]|uniref:hypothetical protein n=1 Tax=Mucilaginibacter sp. OK283 TaxID=1881049 RepID=UPI00115FF2FB|nr:hypothetical protein [Mucilaginibacter sp. OK283]
MKTMTKIIAGAFTAAAIFIGTNVKAQTTPANKLRLGIGITGGIPTGNAHDGSNFLLGGDARLQYGVSNNVALTLTSGYYNFFAKTYDQVDGTTVKGKDQGLIPIKAGVKAFVAENFYLGAEAGVGFETQAHLYGNKDTKLILSPGIGYANKSWDIGARYENYSGQSNSYGFVGLRVAYGFGL